MTLYILENNISLSWCYDRKLNRYLKIRQGFSLFKNDFSLLFFTFFQTPFSTCTRLLGLRTIHWGCFVLGQDCSIKMEGLHTALCDSAFLFVDDVKSQSSHRLPFFRIKSNPISAHASLLGSPHIFPHFLCGRCQWSNPPCYPFQRPGNSLQRGCEYSKTIASHGPQIDLQTIKIHLHLTVLCNRVTNHTEPESWNCPALKGKLWDLVELGPKCVYLTSLLFKKNMGYYLFDKKVCNFHTGPQCTFELGK